MKTIILTIFFGILISTISCKKKEEPNPKEKSKCNESLHSGTWEFTINKDLANEYKDTINLRWNGSTYVINDLISTRSDNASYYRYQTIEESIDIWKEDCKLKYKNSFYARRF